MLIQISEYTVKMGIFKERRTSLPAMKVEAEELTRDLETLELDLSFVERVMFKEGVDIVTQVDLGEFGANKNRNHLILMRLEQVQNDRSLFCLRLSTNINNFKLRTSCSFRSFSNWYYLQSLIQKLFPLIKLRPLPSRHMLWIKDSSSKLEEIAQFLKQIVCHKQLMLNRSVQLFLQTNMSTEYIQENVEGKRHDDVIPRIEFKPETEIVEKISKLDLQKLPGNQITYHGPTDSHKSVQNLFAVRKKSIFVNHIMQPLTEDQNCNPESDYKYRGVVY